MAQIKISGLKENLVVSNEKAQAVNEAWLNESIPNSKKIIIDNITTIKGDIRGIFLTKEEKEIKQFDYERGGIDKTFLSKEQRANMTDYFRKQEWYTERKVLLSDIHSWCQLNNIKIK